jgi:hypothetical protein
MRIQQMRPLIDRHPTDVSVGAVCPEDRHEMVWYALIRSLQQEHTAKVAK